MTDKAGGGPTRGRGAHAGGRGKRVQDRRPTGLLHTTGDNQPTNQPCTSMFANPVCLLQNTQYCVYVA